MNAPEAKLAEPLVTDIGHIILQVGNMEKALHLYHDILGFELAPGQTSTVWKVIRTKGGELTLYQAEKVTSLVLHGEEDTPVTLHVANFEETADTLERAGYKVKRQGRKSGTLVDPWGNLVGLHDHREG